MKLSEHTLLLVIMSYHDISLTLETTYHLIYLICQSQILQTSPLYIGEKMIVRRTVPFLMFGLVPVGRLQTQNQAFTVSTISEMVKLGRVGQALKCLPWKPYGLSV